MRILHTTSFLEQTFTTDAHIFSASLVSPDNTANLLFAQQVAEAQWLNGHPVFAIITPEPLPESAPLFEDVRLIYPKDWLALDAATAFLVNQAMYELIKPPAADFHNLEIATAEQLLQLAMNHTFVVVCAGRSERNNDTI